jgi:hypothetical protein
MPQLIAVVQTTWPKIRVGLYRREDGHFQFVEEGLQPDNFGKEFWYHYYESGLYSAIEAAKADMVRYYVELVEDDRKIDPESVVILKVSNFEI